MIIEDIKRSYLAKKMNISYNTLTKKLNGEREFTLNEILKMKIILDLDMETCANLFFNEENFVYKEKDRGCGLFLYGVDQSKKPSR